MKQSKVNPQKDMTNIIVISETERYHASYLMNKDKSNRVIQTYQKQEVQNRWNKMDSILRSAYKKK